KVGPQLSFVGTSRTQAFLLESILNPKAVITSGYSSILILTKKGKFITGVKMNEDDSSIDLMDKEGKALHIPKDDIKKYKTQKISIMPGNFKDILSQDEVRHLLAYLGTLKLSN
ncbi:MAG: Triheme cytochrome c, partial [Nitrospinaceae bacterium]